MNNENKICTGGCLCGARRYEFEGNPTHSGNCHCNMCKRATGGAFAVLVQARRDTLRWTKEKPDAYRSSPIVTRVSWADIGTVSRRRMLRGKMAPQKIWNQIELNLCNVFQHDGTPVLVN